MRAALKKLRLRLSCQPDNGESSPGGCEKGGLRIRSAAAAGVAEGQRAVGGRAGPLRLCGELSLTGEVRPVHGVLPMVIAARDAGIEQVFVPPPMRRRARWWTASKYTASAMDGTDGPPHRLRPDDACRLAGFDTLPMAPMADFADVMGQARPAGHGNRRGGLPQHPPYRPSRLWKKYAGQTGSPSILPDMTREEALEATKNPLHRRHAAGWRGGCFAPAPFAPPPSQHFRPWIDRRRFPPRPGRSPSRITACFFLDELPEFLRQSMESLRQPLEDGRVTISRVSASLSYPCAFMLAAAMNPCPCGYFGHPPGPAPAPPVQQRQYLSRIRSLLDQLDHVEVPPGGFFSSWPQAAGESSAVIRSRVSAARLVQRRRFRPHRHASSNAPFPPASCGNSARLKATPADCFKTLFERMGLSAQAYDRLLKSPAPRRWRAAIGWRRPRGGGRAIQKSGPREILASQINRLNPLKRSCFPHFVQHVNDVL